jgi:hypothetical protein
MHVVGLALLIFVVLPELDVVKGAMLTNCLCFIPAVLGINPGVRDFFPEIPGRRWGGGDVRMEEVYQTVSQAVEK